MTMKDWMPGWLTYLKNNKILVCKSSTYLRHSLFCVDKSFSKSVNGVCNLWYLIEAVMFGLFRKVVLFLWNALFLKNIR